MRKTISCVGVAVCLGVAVVMAAPERLTDLAEALARAREQNKMLFVEYGREACGNCQALRRYIQEREVRLPEGKYLYADLNCDDPATSRLFDQRFEVKGSTLPLVVVATADGRQLASRSGWGRARDYEELLREAARVAKKSGEK